MEFTVRERKIWIELALDTVIAAYYFISVYQLSGWDEITGREIGGIVINAIVMSIVGSIILHLIFIRNAEEDAKDERDLTIEAKGNTYAYYALFGLCCVIIGQIFITEGAEYLFPGRQDVLMTAPFIMHLIGLSLLVSSFAKSITRIVCYRRGY